MASIPRRKNSKPFRLLLLACSLLLLFVIAGALFIVVTGRSENVFPADVAVVLGNEVHTDGSVSPRLAARLDRGATLYREGFCRVLIVSGGLGKSGYDEATAMAAYLIAAGIPETAVVLDHDGANSWSTAVFTAAYMRDNGLRSAMVVSQYFHVPRSRMALRMALRDSGYAPEGTPLPIGGACPDYYEWRDIFSIVREVAAIFIYPVRHGSWRDLSFLVDG